MNVQIRIMQDNLCDLRKIAGWTAETIAGMLGVTKQTISNLENKKVKLSRIQYIAIRAIFECEAASNSKNTTLRKVMAVLFEEMIPVYDARREEVRTAMLSIASISAAGVNGLQLYSSAIALLAPLGKATIQMSSTHIGEPSLRWLLEALQFPVSTEIQNEENGEESSIDENS
jgi:transcriptional regulator with XRE-family HTH domain